MDMSLEDRAVDDIPILTWATPVAACLLLAGYFTELVPSTSVLSLIIATLLLGGSVFASVHHAEVVALRVGEPFGSIVLAISVTVIEVALIISLMLAAKAGSDILARDTVFATVMMVLNGIVGLCLVVGGARHGEQVFQTNASSTALSVIGTMAAITLVLPNYTLATPGPVYAPSQLIVVGAVSIILYCVFLFVQTIRHREYFLSAVDDAPEDSHHHGPVPSARTTLISLALLGLSLVAVVLLAKVLSPSIENAVAAAHLPNSFVGVVIAAVVLLPEGMAAVRAARNNHLQTSLNLALGSAIATIGLTIPVIAIVSLVLGQRLTLGLGSEEIVLLTLTLFISTVTLATGRTTILQGTVHLVIFSVFMLLAAVP